MRESTLTIIANTKLRNSVSFGRGTHGLGLL